MAGRISCSGSLHQSEYSLCSAPRDWLDCMCATDSLHACFRKAEVLDLTLLNQVLHRSCYILDRHVWVNPVLIVQIDHVGLEALERSLDRFLDVLRPAIQGIPLASILRIRSPAELGGNDHPIAEWSKSLAYEFFVREWTVDFGRIEKCDAAFDRRSNQGDSLLLVYRRAVAKAQPHASQPNGRYFQIAFSKFTFLHDFSCARKFGLSQLHRTG
jgi:hypothetical protein